MKRIRCIVPKPVHLLGLAAAAIVGIAIAGQNQDEPKTTTQSKTNTQKTATADDQTTPSTTTGKTKNARGNATNANERNANSNASNEHSQPAALGAQFDAQGNQGLRVTSIEQNGILAQAGLKQNDQIVSAQGHTFTNARQFEAFLWAQQGQAVPIIVNRGGQQVTLQAQIPMPSSDGGWLGVFLDEGDPNIQGARVTQVYPSGPAARAGIQVGDVITQINQQKVGGSADAVMLIREMQPQAHVELAVMRNKEELKIPVVLGSRQQSGYQSFYGGQGQFPPGQFAQGQFGQGQFPQGQGNGQQGYPGENQFQGVPPHAMQLESERRNFEQHERIEEEIRALRAEVQEIRKLLEKK